MSRPIDVILSRVLDAKPSGRDRWRCACPAHAGTNRSTLSIADTPSGAVLLRCWSGCSIEAIMAALDLDVAALFPPKLTGSAPLKRRGLLSAGQALGVIEFECALVRLAASNLANGHQLTHDDLERLNVAAARIGALAVEARS